MKIRDKLLEVFTRNPRQTGDSIVAIAQRGRHGGKEAVTEHEFRRLCMSAISQAKR